MDFSLRPARRFDYGGTVEVGARPIPRVMRPAMDTISRPQSVPEPLHAERPAASRPSLPLKPSVQPPGEVAVRPALHLSGHPNTTQDEEAPLPLSIAEKIEAALSVLPEEEESQDTKGKQKRRLFHGKRRLAIAAAVLLVVGGVGVLLRSADASQQTGVLSAHNEVVTSAAPSAASSSVTYEEPPANHLSTYQVGKMQARVITIASIGLEARLLPVGVDGRGQPQLPTHAYDTGWYNVSAKPGEAGTVVVSGTCSTEAGKGVFDKLGSVNKGDSIAIERGDGTRISYSVKEIYRNPVDSLDMTKVLSPFDPKAPGLSLVTCDGSYNRSTNDSADRLVIRAVQI